MFESHDNDILNIQPFDDQSSARNEEIDPQEKIKDFDYYEEKFLILAGKGKLNDTDRNTDLFSPTEDIKKIKKIFKNSDFKKIELFNKSNQSGNIEQEIENILNSELIKKKRKLILLYYSGHGKQKKDSNFYIFPNEKHLNIENIFDRLSRIENCHSIVILGKKKINK